MKYKIAVLLAATAALGSICLGLSLIFASFPTEIIASFTPQILAIVGILFITATALLRMPKFRIHLKLCVILSVVSFVVSSVSLFYIFNTQPATSTGTSSQSTDLRFAQFNKLGSNADYTAIANYLRTQRVDVAAFEETTPPALAKIAELSGLTFTAPAGGVGIMSRLPLHNPTIIPFGGGYGTVRAEIDAPNGKRLAIYATHITPPFSANWYKSGNNQLERLGRILSAETLPVVLGGDFNTTIYSPKMKEFNRTTSNVIQSTTIGAFPACSWIGYSQPLCLRIDHIYIPPTASLKSITISPNLGSDHRMVIADITL